MPRVYVGVGSNIDRAQHIRGAVRALGRRYGPLTVSSVYRTPPVGFIGPDFYNLAIGFVTEESPQALHRELARIEQAHGRVRWGSGWHSRTLDLDLLLYGDRVQHDAELDLPRREIGEYAHVLLPLAEIAPHERHPETGETYSAMWARLFEPWGVPPHRVRLDLDTWACEPPVRTPDR